MEIFIKYRESFFESLLTLVELKVNRPSPWFGEKYLTAAAAAGSL